MIEKDLWSLGKPAKSFPSDWLVVPVKDAVEFEKPCVLCKTNKAVHCWECSMNLVREAREEHKREIRKIFKELNDNKCIGHDEYEKFDKYVKARLCEKKEVEK